MNKIIAIIPARGGSKRLKGKNIYPLLGKPLIRWTIDEALKSKYINKDNLYVSTDSEDIENIVKDYCAVIYRHKKLSGDNVWTQPVIDNVIQRLKFEFKDDDIIVILQANSPEIKYEVIDECIEKLIDKKLFQIHTVDKDLINNGAIQILRKKVSLHKGKANYNAVYVTDWIDVHYKKDILKIEKKMRND